MPQPDPDPSEAYAIKNVPAELRGPPTDWWMVTRNGVPAHFFAPDKRADARALPGRPGIPASLATA